MSHVNPKVKYEVVPLGVDTELLCTHSVPKPGIVAQENQRRSFKTTHPFCGADGGAEGSSFDRPIIEHHGEWHWVLVGRPDDFNPGGMVNEEPYLFSKFV